MAEPVYSHTAANAAMCIMEEIADPTLSTTPWKDYREQVGVCQLRDDILQKLALECDNAWDRAYRRAEEKERNATTRAEAQSVEFPLGFDYEFVPVWLRECVDWSDDMNGPVVRYTTVSEKADG